MSIHNREDLIDCKKNPHIQVTLRKLRPCQQSDRTGDGREGTGGTRPSQEEVEPIPGSSLGRIPAHGLAGRNAGSHLCWVQPPGMAIMGTGSWSGRWAAGCEGHQPCAPGTASCPAREVRPTGATSMSMAVPLHKPHAAEEGRAVQMRPGRDSQMRS